MVSYLYATNAPFKVIPLQAELCYVAYKNLK